MKSYSIHELERLTGIKAHTIRIWEKRFDLITPQRTTTNRRYYNDAQVRKLLNVNTLLARGYKISTIVSFTDQQAIDLIEKNSEQQSAEMITVKYVNELIRYMLQLDEPNFDAIFEACIAKLGVFETMQQVIYPFLRKTGVLWSVSKTTPVEEHFATSIIERKLMTAIDKCSPQKNKTKKFVLFLPPREWHEIGLLYANYIIRSKGYTTYYLGQNIPFENVQKMIMQTTPDYLLLFYVAGRPIEEIERQLSVLSKNNKGLDILVAGSGELLVHDKSKMKNVGYLPDVNSLLSIL